MTPRRFGLSVLSLFLAVLAWAAAPPRSTPALTQEQRKEIDQLTEQLARQAHAGEFAAATKTAERILTWREQKQGASHWETVDARHAIERWRRLGNLPVEKREQIGLALLKLREGERLRRQRKYNETDQKDREALELDRQALGEMHSETALSYNQVAVNLEDQGKYSEAEPLYRKALEIDRKFLGDTHPDTATCYNNVANNLNSQGKYREAAPLFRKALDIRRQVLGEMHPETALSYNNIAYNLNVQGNHRDAAPLFRKALDIRRTVLGEMHPDTTVSYNSVAYNLVTQGNYRGAEPLFRKALDIRRTVLGEMHSDTANSYNNLAYILQAQGKYGEAEPLDRKALEIRRTVLGEMHPSTAASYNNLAANLDFQGNYRDAEPLFRKALEIKYKTLGEMHPDTALSYNNVAYNLNVQGKHNEAEPLFRKTLEIFRTVLGELHADTATCYDNVAGNLDVQGKHGDAEILHRKALNISRKVLGEMHPDTAASYNNLAVSLDAQGKYSEAEPLLRKALEIRRKVLGELHPAAAASCNNLAVNLHAQGKYSEAEPLYLQALEIRRKVLGEVHPDTALSYNKVASGLWEQGKFAEAAKQYRAALLPEESGRLRVASSGFDRALSGVNTFSSRTGLALCLARLKQPREAWLHAETGLALSLLDDLISETPQPAGSDQTARFQRLKQINGLLLSLLSGEKISEPQRQERDRLLAERQRLESAQASEAAERSARRVWSLERIQKQIPADAAILLPSDSLGHWVCILRSKGDPVWLALPGSGPRQEWTAKDNGVASLTLEALQDPTRDEATRQQLLSSLAKQRLAPLEPLLGANGTLPAVGHLLVIPVGDLAAVPVEALTSRYRVSYIPSASVFARFMEQHRPLRADSLLAVGDPVFTAATVRLPEPPAAGLLVRTILPGGAAARAGLQPGDVLLRYDDTPLKTPADLRISSSRVSVVVWRDGKEFKARISGGSLGATLDKRPAAQAVRDWQKSSLVSRGGTSYPRLPGTRLEVETLKRIVDNAVCLTGSEASEQSLRQLASSGKLKSFRLLHLATHGEANPASPDLTCLILAQDKLPARLDDAVAAVLSREKPLDGRLTVGAIRQTWHLDADLVVLSACETGRGKKTGNEGMLGFTQALLAKGARSVVLSRWKVDDSATTLLMLRFYENVLGKRAGLKAPLKRAEALQEAKNWLRTLRRQEAEKLVVRLSGGELRGTIGEALPAAKGKPVPLPSGDRPYASAYYWSAFVLVGDPF